MTHGKVKLRAVDVVAGIGCLDNHLLPLNGPIGEGELETLAACWVGRSHGGETVGKVVTDSPGRLVGTREGASTLAAGLSGHTVG